jgi:signal transduction histidine kinase
MAEAEASSARSVVAVARSAVREPFGPRARREALFCVIGTIVSVIGLALVGLILFPGTAVSAIRGVVIFGALMTFLVASGGARRIGAAGRLAARLLDEDVPEPPALPPARTRAGRMRTRLRDTSGWRALAYLVLKLPLGQLELYALTYWLGLIGLTFPFWWRLFRNHAPGVELSPVYFLTPFGAVRVGSFVGTFVVFGMSAMFVLAAPWVTRGVVWVDRWLIGILLGPGKVAVRIRTLEETRARAVEDSATTLRRIERDLHDGTQAQLATLAMKLGQAKEKLEVGSGLPYDPTGALKIVEDAHRQAKETLVELRDIARGIHPPALDLGLDAALTTLVARSAVPASLRYDVRDRPAQAIETIGYFSAAELLANVAKHSRASTAAVLVTGTNGRLLLTVTDDGIGGAHLGGGSGLRGLDERVRAVDGSMMVISPTGGPTEVTVELPLHA